MKRSDSKEDYIKLAEKAALYFEGCSGFDRLFEKMRSKYKSLGRIGGSVKLSEMSETEKESLTGLLKRDCYRKSISVKLEQVEAAFESTPFSGVSLVDVMESYFKEALRTNECETLEYRRKRDDFFSGIAERYEGTPAAKWLLKAAAAGECGGKVLAKRYNSDSGNLECDIKKVMNALCNLPGISGKKQRLAIFAARFADGPHDFDRGSGCDKLLMHALAYIYGEEYPENAEERAYILYSAGILVDDVSNFTLCSGIAGCIGGELHPGWQGFCEAGEPLHVSVANLSAVDDVDCKFKRVFIVENPAVFSEILECSNIKGPPLVCTFGQVKLASLMLIDMIFEKGIQIWYSGDFDPEGLQIAVKLKKGMVEDLCFGDTV